MIVGLLVQTALAQTFTADEAVLTASSVNSGGAWSSVTSDTITTVGSPALFRDETAGLTLMFYETQIGGTTTACPAGEWGIGLAYFQTSIFGGGNWIDVGPILTPSAGSYYSCVVAHPTVVTLGDPINRQWVVYFKAELDPAACTPNSDYACDRYPGFGRFIFEYNPVGPTTNGGTVGNYAYTAPDASPVLEGLADQSGYPSAVFADGNYRIAYAVNPDVYFTEGPFTSGLGPTTDFPTPKAAGIVYTDATGWADDELFAPSLTCSGTSAGGDLAYELFTGGRTFLVYPDIADSSLGRFDSTDYATWAEGAGVPLASVSNGDREIRHLDAHTSGSAGYGMFYSTPRGGAVKGNDIRLLRNAAFQQGSINAKRCP